MYVDSSEDDTQNIAKDLVAGIDYHVTIGYGDGKNPISYLEVKWRQPGLVGETIEDMIDGWEYLSGNEKHGMSYSPSWTTTTTTAAPVQRRRKKEKEYDLNNYTMLTNIWNTTLNATDIENDKPATVSVETLLYMYSNYNLPKCAVSESGFDNCTMFMILHPSFGPWTPLRENYTRKSYHNPHFFNTDDVCLHMASSNEDLVSSGPDGGTRAVPLIPAGHRLEITPNPWRYGSTTITVTATAFNRTLGELLVQQKKDKEKEALLAKREIYRQQFNNSVAKNVSVFNQSWFNPLLHLFWVAPEGIQQVADAKGYNGKILLCFVL